MCIFIHFLNIYSFTLLFQNVMIYIVDLVCITFAFNKTENNIHKKYFFLIFRGEKTRLSKKPCFENMKNKNQKSFLECAGGLSSPALTLLLIGLPLTLFSAIRLLSAMILHIDQDPIYVLLTYPAYLEHILMSLCILFCGAAVLDIEMHRVS